MGLFSFFKKPSGRESVAGSRSQTVTLARAQEIAGKFGGFLSDALPVIKDTRRLPYPKETIDQALATWILHLRQQSGPEVAQLIGHLEFSQLGLQQFASIDPEDQAEVDRFNQFQSMSAVPDDEKQACLRLAAKYRSRGIET